MGPPRLGGSVRGRAGQLRNLSRRQTFEAEVHEQLTVGVKGGPVNAPGAIGLVLYHAYLVYDQNNNFYLASNPVTLRLEK